MEKNINKVRLLFKKLFINNIFICAYGFRDNIIKRFRKLTKLKDNYDKELLSIASIALAMSEEEAYYKILLIK